MKYYLLPILALLVVGCGSQRSKQETAVQSIKSRTIDSATEHAVTENAIELSQDSTMNVAGLNAIRFGNWTDKDWHDNDYFRVLREYIDAYLQGVIENEILNPYKYILKSKFAIYSAAPCIGGGMFLCVVFLDEPNTLFDAWVYSDVDEDTNTVVDYRVKRFSPREDTSLGMTKDDILAIIKEHPENKLW